MVHTEGRNAVGAEIRDEKKLIFKMLEMHINILRVSLQNGRLQ